jgi:CTP:molybdopterin cytidylyltransferase MocA
MGNHQFTEFEAARLIGPDASLGAALAALNRLAKDLTLFVIDDGIVVGSVTDGDLRRGLLDGVGLDSLVRNAMNPNVRTLVDGEYTPEDLAAFKSAGLHLAPIVDPAGALLGLLNLRVTKTVLPVDAVIVAGGEGRRLRPATDSVPKPMLEVGGKPILEYAIKQLAFHGIAKVHLAVRYLGEQIESHFGSGERFGIRVEYIREEAPLGTLGCLGLIDDFKQDAVLVMNSDLLTTADLEDFYSCFRASGAAMAVATIPHEVAVPYAVMEQVLPWPLLGYWLDIGRPEDLEKARRDVLHLRV